MLDLRTLSLANAVRLSTLGLSATVIVSAFHLGACSNSYARTAVDAAVQFDANADVLSGDVGDVDAEVDDRASDANFSDVATDSMSSEDVSVCGAAERRCGGACVNCPEDPNATGVGCSGRACVILGCRLPARLSVSGDACERYTGPFAASGIALGAADRGTNVELSHDGNVLLVRQHPNLVRVFRRQGNVWDAGTQIHDGGPIQGGGRQQALTADGDVVLLREYTRPMVEYRYVAGSWQGRTLDESIPTLLPAAPPASRPWAMQTFALSGDGNTVLVTYTNSSVHPVDVQVVAFRRSGDAWRRESELPNRRTIEPTSIILPMDIAHDGNTAVVGTYWPGSTNGHVYVYTRDQGGHWSEPTAIAAPAATADSVPIEVAISADGNSILSFRPEGSAAPFHLYVRSPNGSWRLEHTFGSPNTAVARMAVSADCKTIALGNPSAVDRNGAVTVYVREIDGWSRGVNMLRPDGAVAFGLYVALSGNGATLAASDFFGATSLTVFDRLAR